ncbi:MAG: YbhB/YbcL family Raf kinase inhibitor-like protein [Verrucomicrobiota bacterium]|jgi:Raf kinase inhibitor-like YbhB/YbcL family protein
MRISSPAFEDGGTIPERYTREGGNKRPSLKFEGIPPTAQSLALIVDNPEAPQGAFTHWIVFNLSPATRELNENVMPTILQQGRNDYGQDGYAGPKSPSNEHHYFFRLYALDSRLTLTHGVSRLDLEEAMIGHIIAVAECQGQFGAPVAVAG